MARPRTDHQEHTSPSVSDWKRRRHAPATLPTGQQVTLRRLTLDELAADDALSNELVAAVVLELQPGGIAVEMARLQDLEKQRELGRDMLRVRDALVLRAVVEPALEPADIPELDPFDKAMIADIASGQSDVDATGRRVWGVEPLNTFQAFRDEHGCDEGCEACDRVVREFSGVQ